VIVVRNDFDLAAVDAALGIDLVGGELRRLRAIACASAITPILRVSAASAPLGLAAKRPNTAAPASCCIA
jgi:hypothetical protein